MSTLHRNSIIGFFLVAFFVTLSACGQKQPQELPTGTLSFSGSLVQAELSLTRRGTHILRQNDRDVYYVESSTVNLNQYAGMDVTITGHLEHNSDPNAQPVIVADSVVLIQVPSHSWSIPALSMNFSAPLTWQGTLFSDGISFTETGSAAPILKIHRSSLNALTTGTPLVIGGQEAVKATSGSGDVLYVANGKDVIAIEASSSLSVSTGSSSEQQNLERLLKSITFTGGGSSSFGSGTTVHTGTGGMAGTPCGGSAGILCPAGSYCEITDRTSGIGVCQSLSH